MGRSITHWFLFEKYVSHPRQSIPRMLYDFVRSVSGSASPLPTGLYRECEFLAYRFGLEFSGIIGRSVTCRVQQIRDASPPHHHVSTPRGFSTRTILPRAVKAAALDASVQYLILSGRGQKALGNEYSTSRPMQLECTAAGALSVPNQRRGLWTVVLFPPKSLPQNHLAPQKSPSSL